MNNTRDDKSESCKLSDIYNGYDDLILLHGMSRIGAIDRIPREMFVRYSKIKESRISGFLIRIGNPFKNWGASAGAIIKDSNIIAAKNEDGGFDDELNPVIQVNPDDIKSIVKDINDSNLQKKYSELFYENAEVKGIYYIKEPKITDYSKIDVRKTQEKFYIENVYEIDHKTGSVFIMEWAGNDYIQVKQISNREELLNQNINGNM